MITQPLTYLLSVALLAALFSLAERSGRIRLFTHLPAVVLIYAAAMLCAQLEVWERSDAIASAYTAAKNNLLPAMIFLMMLQVDLRAFFRLGPTLLVAYAAAVISLAAAFVTVFWLFGFSSGEAGLFAALCGSWMGGTANMLAVASALEVSEAMVGYALVVDSVNYTLWVVLLLALVPFAARFNRFSGALPSKAFSEAPGCACDVGPKRYWPLLVLSLLVTVLVQSAAPLLGGLGTTAWSVLIATVLGLAAAQTPLNQVNGSSQIASAMLYLLVALIGSRAAFDGLAEVPFYLLAGAVILLMHGAVMVIAARLFRLDLFSIGVASLANIGGVASAPILAAAYDRALIGVAVLMAIMGYLIGTFAGLGVGYLLQATAS